MFRFLLSAVSIFVLIVSTFFLSHPVSASRCPVRNPSTLLSLYRNSEFIYVGTYDKTDEGKPIEGSEEYAVIPLKRHFTISSALKGESRKLVVVEDEEYRYKRVDPVEEEGEAKDAETWGALRRKNVS